MNVHTHIYTLGEYLVLLCILITPMVSTLSSTDLFTRLWATVCIRVIGTVTATTNTTNTVVKVDTGEDNGMYFTQNYRACQ